MKKIGFLLIVLFGVFLCSCKDSSSTKKQQIIEEATERWQEFLDTNQLSIVVDAHISVRSDKGDVYMENQIEYSEAKICQSPFYLEAKANDECIVIQEEEGKFYQYSVPVSQKVEFVTRQEIKDLSFIEDLTADYYEEDPFSGFNMKFIKVNQEQDVYTFQMNLGYYLQAAGATDELEKIISTLDGDISIFFDSLLTMSMSFADTSANLKIEMELKHKDLVFLIEIDTKLNKQEFYKINFYDKTKYYFLPPSNIADIFQFTKKDEPLLIPAESTNYFKYELTKGQYGFYGTILADNGVVSWTPFGRSKDNFLDLKLFNEKLEEVPLGIEIDSNSIRVAENTFYISEPGIYYLCVQSQYTSDIKIRLYQEMFDTIGFESSNELVSNKGVIEGYYDFDVYTIDGKENEVALIKNLGNGFLSVIDCETGDSQVIYNLLSFIVRLHEGENKFIICGDSTYIEYPFEYEITSQKYALENGYEENYEDLKKLTTDFSDLFYVVGYEFPKPRLTLDVEVRSIIELEFLFDEYGSQNVESRITDLDGNEIDQSPYNIFELNPGKYIVELSGYNISVSSFHIKYKATEFEDEEVDVMLEEGSLTQLYDDFPSVKAQNIARTQEVKYNFKLTEDSLVAYENFYVDLFCKDGTPVFCPLETSGFIKLVYLPKGEYYYIIKEEGTYYSPSREHEIGIVHDDLDTIFNLDQMKEIEIDKELEFKKDWQYDVEYLILHIQEEGKYQVNHLIRVYDENLNFLVSTYDTLELSVGTYYLTYEYSYYSVINDKVSIIITKYINE